MKAEFRAHPIMIFERVKPVLLVFLIPLFKAVTQYIKYGKIDDIMGYEFASIAIAAVYSTLSWLAFRITVENNYITIKNGVLFSSVSKIDINKLSSVQTERSLFDWLIGAVTYRINTEAGQKRKSDFVFKLSKKSSKRLFLSLYVAENLKKVPFSPIQVAFMSVTTSSAFTGLVVGVPILNNMARLVGVGINEVFDELNTVSNSFNTYFPPIVNTVTLIIVLAYVLSFFYLFLKYINFKLYLNDNILRVSSGFFVRRRTVFKKAAVNDVKIEQTFLMHLLRRYAMRVSVGGFGVQKNSEQIIVPSGTKMQIKQKFFDFFPFLKPDGITIRPHRRTELRNRFLILPVLLTLLTCAVSLILSNKFEEFNHLIFFITIIIFCVIFYYGYLCIYEYHHGKFCLGKTVFARSAYGLRTCRLYCPVENIGEIKLIRFGIDFKHNTCRTRVTVSSESADSIMVRHLDYTEVCNQINQAFNINV